MGRTIEQNVLTPRQINSGRDKGNGAGGLVDASSSAPGPRDLSPQLQTSQPKPRKQEVQKLRLAGGGRRSEGAEVTARWEGGGFIGAGKKKHKEEKWCVNYIHMLTLYFAL